jgi:hypothetical protein
VINVDTPGIPKRKYRITDPETVGLLTETAISKPRKEEKKPDDYKPDLKKVRLIIISALAGLLIIAALAAGFFMDLRGTNLKKGEAQKRVQEFIDISNAGKSSDIDDAAFFAKADLLLVFLDSRIKEYPGEDLYKELYGVVSLRSYVKKWKSDLEDGIDIHTRPDSITVAYINKYKPQYAGIPDLLEELAPYILFNSNFPYGLKTTDAVPQDWEVYEVLEEGDRLEELIKKNYNALSIAFPALLEYSQVILNNVYPNILNWKSFWELYNNYLSKTEEDQKTSVLRALRLQYANILSILKTEGGSSEDTERGYILGISKNSPRQYYSASFNNELKPLISLLSQKKGLSISLKVYDHEEELFIDYIKGSVDFAIFENLSTTRLYLSGYRNFALIRTWDKKSYVDKLEVHKSRLHPDSRFNNLYSFSNEDFLVYFRNLRSQKRNVDSLLKNFRYTDDPVQTMRLINDNKAYYTLATEEQFRYSPNFGINKDDLTAKKTGVKDMLSVLWLSENMNPKFAAEIKNLLVSGAGKLGGKKGIYTSWKELSLKELDNYCRNNTIFSTPFFNTILLKEIKTDGNIPMEGLKYAVCTTFTNNGYNVVDLQSVNADRVLLDEFYTYFLHVEAFVKSSEEIQIKFKIVRSHIDSERVVFYDVISVSRKLLEPSPGGGTVKINFLPSMLDLSSYIHIYGIVTEKANNIITVKTPVKVWANTNDEVKFTKAGNLVDYTYKRTKTKQGAYYAKGKIFENKNGIIHIRVDSDTFAKIETGDYAEIND